MSLSPGQIQAIAGLARLALESGEIAAYTESLSRILDLIGQLEKADTAGVAPMAHPLGDQAQRLREDVPGSPDARELYQRNAPATAAGLYLVPRVIE